MFRIYLVYILVTILGWYFGETVSQYLSGLNDLKWLRAAISIGVGSLAVQQAMSIKNRLGQIQAIEGLTSTERSRIKGIISTLKTESLFGFIVVLIGNIFVVITAFAIFNAEAPLTIILSSFFSIIFFSMLLLIRMHWYLGNQIDNFESQIKHRIEDKERRNELLDKLNK